MERFTSLDAVRRRVWRRLQEAVADPGHAYRTLTFGTATDGAPHLRTVILRAADPEARRLAFHTDRRSRKVEHIRALDRIAWLGWDPGTKEQIRLHGTASVHLDDAVADAMWAAQAPSSLDIYVRPPAPGTPLDAPDDGLDPSVTDGPVTREDVAGGRQHFAVVRTVIDEIEWLHLHPEGQYRAQFRFDASTEAFAGDWVVP